MCLTSIVQQKQISGRNPAAQSNPQQQLLMKLGPIMITFFSLIVPAGLAVYFFVSNLYRVAQQELISRTIYRTPEAIKLREIQAKEHAEKQAKGGAEEGLLRQAARRRRRCRSASPRGRQRQRKAGRWEAPRKANGGSAPTKPPRQSGGDERRPLDLDPRRRARRRSGSRPPWNG